MKMRYWPEVVLNPLRSPIRAYHAVVRQFRAKYKSGISGDLINQTEEDDLYAESAYTERLRLPDNRGKEHELIITRDFLDFLGISVSEKDVRPEFWLSSDDSAWADSRIPDRKGEVVLALSPASSMFWGRSYPPEKYKDIFHALGDYTFRVVLFGTASEKQFISCVIKAIEDCSNISAVCDLAGQSTLRQMAAAFSRCDVILAAETAAAHIAVALNKPAVCIMGGGHFGRFYPWGDPETSRVAHIPMDCYWCNWHCRHSRIKCIQEIPPDTITHELKYLLENAVNRL
jgi:ADP-heptose:LPS heptosyltransferase